MARPLHGAHRKPGPHPGCHQYLRPRRRRYPQLVVDPPHQWRPDEFNKKHAEASTASASGEFYLLDIDNPSSVHPSIAAPENARMLRALISTEMWLQINVFYG